MIINQDGPQNVDQVKTYIDCGELFLSPEEYQRENAWTPSQKRLLIDTIFRRMDIPKLYFWKIDGSTLANGYPDGETKDLYRRILERKRREDDDPDPFIYEAVDGQQRIRAIMEYMGVRPPTADCYRGTWHEPYSALRETPMAQGRHYEQLNPAQRNQFGQGRLTIMILQNATIDEIRDMFLRLQNGTPLNAQQKRDAMGSFIGRYARELAESRFFTGSVSFDNRNSDHHHVASQMLLLESKEKVVPCTSQRLDRFYGQHRSVELGSEIVQRARRVVRILGQMFPDRNPGLNRSYAIGLYWTISRITLTYRVDESAYSTMRTNFERLDQQRLEAMNRDYTANGDELYAELSQSMSHGTDGAERIGTRYDILAQFLFADVDLQPHPDLDPTRSFSRDERLILYRRANGRCLLGSADNPCGREVEFDDGAADHIIPHSRGGITSLENGRFVHRRCNISRGIRDDFAPDRECVLMREQETLDID